MRTWKENPVVMGVAGFILAMTPFSRAQTGVNALYNRVMAGQIVSSKPSSNFSCPTCDLLSHRNYFYSPASDVSSLASSTSSIISGFASPQVSQDASSWTPGQALPGITDLSKVVDPTFKTNCKVTKTYPKFVFCGDLAAQAEELAPVWYEQATGEKPDEPISFESL